MQYFITYPISLRCQFFRSTKNHLLSHPIRNIFRSLKSPPEGANSRQRLSFHKIIDGRYKVAKHQNIRDKSVRQRLGSIPNLLYYSFYWKVFYFINFKVFFLYKPSLDRACRLFLFTLSTTDDTVIYWIFTREIFHFFDLLKANCKSNLSPHLFN